MQYTTQDLAGVVGKLPEKDRQFATSLIKQADQRVLSEKQSYWVDVLTKRAKGEDKVAAVDVGDLSAVIALFDKAAQHLQHPKVLLSLPHGSVRLGVAGPRARVPGSINVTSVARFGEGAFYGRITRNGQFQPTPTGRKVEGLVGALKAFAADPEKVASEYGRLTGSCCFCHIPLRDARSTAVGYGPICAEHWNLPWGAKE